MVAGREAAAVAARGRDESVSIWSILRRTDAAALYQDTGHFSR